MGRGRAERVRVVPDGTDGFALVLPPNYGGLGGVWGRPSRRETRLTGEAAVFAASRVLPQLNRGG